VASAPLQLIPTGWLYQPLSSGERLAAAVTVVRDAMVAQPEMIGGRHDRLDTPARPVEKLGAEPLLERAHLE